MRPNAAACICLTPPTVEPVSLSEAKAHLRVDGSDEDTYISACITAARTRLEHETRRAFIKQQWMAEITGDIGGACNVELPRPRLMVAETFLLEYRNTSGTWTAWTDCAKGGVREPALLWIPNLPSDVDAPISAQDAVWRATYWAGYGETAAEVPGPLRSAIMLMTAHLFERREAVVSGMTITEVPKSVDWLVDSCRVPWEGGVR